MIGYRLVVIEEEQTPLAAGEMLNGNFFFLITIIVMIAIIIATILGIYYFKCMQYRKRLSELKKNGVDIKLSWNLKALKEEVTEIEWNLVNIF